MIRGRIAALASCACLVATGGGAVARAPASLCRPGEAVAFTCSVAARTLAVCGAGPVALYRFGRPGRIELEARRPTFAARPYAGGGEAQIAFASRGYSYVVYDRTVRMSVARDGRHDAAASRGVLVVRDGRVLADRPCRDDGSGDLYEGGKGMAPGRLVAH